MMFLYGALTGAVGVFTLCLLINKKPKGFKPADLLPTPRPPSMPLTDQDLSDLEKDINNQKEIKYVEVERLDPEGKAGAFNDHLAMRRRKHRAESSDSNGRG